MRISHCFEDIFHEHVFAYRKHHGTDTGLLSLTERWRKELDQHIVIGIVSMGLSKAFLTPPHDLIVAKLKSYGTDDKTIDLVHDCLTNRHPQRVRLGNHFLNWNEISAGVPQGSVLGPLIFNIFMNDLVYAVKQGTLLAYPDDTQIFFPHSILKKVEVINADFAKVDQWYEQNGKKTKNAKYQAIVTGNTQVILP